MFYLDKTPTGRHAPNWRYYLLVMHHDYGKKIRQHGRPKQRQLQGNNIARPKKIIINH